MSRKMEDTARTLTAFHPSASPKANPNFESVKASAFSTFIPRLLCMLKKNHILLGKWEYDKFMVLKIAWKMVLRIPWKILPMFLVNSISNF